MEDSLARILEAHIVTTLFMVGDISVTPLLVFVVILLLLAFSFCISMIGLVKALARTIIERGISLRLNIFGISIIFDNRENREKENIADS